MIIGSTPELHVEGRSATITLQRPSQANRLGPDDLEALVAHIARVNAMPEVLVLRLRATGKYFCSGYDIARISGPRPVSFEDMTNALEQARPVTIAAIQGGVYGGATDMALACDFRIGVSGVDMFVPAAKLGLHYNRSGMERLICRLRPNAAARILLTAERIPAPEMKEIGYLTHLVEPGALDDALEAITLTLGRMAPLALLGMKKHLNRMARRALDEEELSRDIAAAAASADLLEGRAAWAEKRQPVFAGS